MHGEKQIVELIKSVELFGQIRPVVIDEKNVILAGNGLVEALIKMGRTEADAIVMTGLSESDKKKLMIADNKVYELGAIDFDNVLAVLEEIKFEDGALGIVPGFDSETLETLFLDEEMVDRRITEYAVLSEETVETFQKKQEEVEKKIENPPERTQEIVLSEDKVQVQQDSPYERPRPYVICEHCGETIWL